MQQFNYNGVSKEKPLNVHLFENLPEPIDIDLDLSKRMIYWADRGDPPRAECLAAKGRRRYVVEQFEQSGIKIS